MTETEMKLRDAEIQFQLGLGQAHNEEIVRSCINSLISLGRSVTFVMQRESAENENLKDWYEKRMALLNSSEHAPLLRYFNERRVYSIHKGVVAPQAVAVKVTNFTKNGVLQTDQPTLTLLRFDDVQKHLPGDSGGVFRLSEKYLNLLRGLVSEWLNKRRELDIH